MIQKKSVFIKKIMKCINQNKKRLASVSRSKKPTKATKNKNYTICSKKDENKPKEKFNDNQIESQQTGKNNESEKLKVSPQVVRTTFDSINVYLENMKAFYLYQAEKLSENVKKIDQKIEFVIPKK